MSEAKGPSGPSVRLWQPISSAPVAVDLELAVIEGDGVVAIQFPCRRGNGGWIDSQTKKIVDVSPTHWRPWRHSEEPEVLRELAQRARTLAEVLPEPDKSRILKYVQELEALVAEVQPGRDQRRVPDHRDY